MIVKIETTGISVRHGKVQLRFSYYLELGDARFEEHYIKVPVIPPGGYPGEVDDTELPTDWDAYNAWEDSLPKIWQNTPFHNHMERVSPDVRDGEIRQLMRDDLVKFYAVWEQGKEKWVEYLRSGGWKRKGWNMRGDESLENIHRCALKGLDIANRATSFEYRGRS